MCGDLVKGSAVSNRSDERDNEVIAGVRKALAQPEPGDRGAILLDGWMESEGDAVRVVYEQCVARSENSDWSWSWNPIVENGLGMDKSLASGPALSWAAPSPFLGLRRDVSACL